MFGGASQHKFALLSPGKVGVSGGNLQCWCPERAVRGSGGHGDRREGGYLKKRPERGRGHTTLPTSRFHPSSGGLFPCCFFRALYAHENSWNTTFTIRVLQKQQNKRMVPPTSGPGNQSCGREWRCKTAPNKDPLLLHQPATLRLSPSCPVRMLLRGGGPASPQQAEGLRSVSAID